MRVRTSPVLLELEDKLGFSLTKPLPILRNELGLLPLLACLPFMYLPKLLQGDTQPWILFCAILALFSYRTHAFIADPRRDVVLITLSALSLFAYIIRSPFNLLVVRETYTQFTFVCLWLVCSRGHSAHFSWALRFTVAIWFAFGAYETLSVALGHGLGVPEFLIGRFVPGRSGVPGLTAEPSFYGSLSMVQMMYLLSERDRKNAPYIVCAGLSVILSGSVLALILLAFPCMKLPSRYRIAAFVVLPAIGIANYFFSFAGLVTRVAYLDFRSVTALLLDPSLNIRLGNIYYTLWVHLIPSLSLTTQVDYQREYSAFAAYSGVFYDPNTPFILPAIGALIYGSGAFGLLQLLAFLDSARRQGAGFMGKVEKIVFVVACMLNPITLANPFLIIYSLKRDDANLQIDRTFAVDNGLRTEDTAQRKSL